MRLIELFESKEQHYATDTSGYDKHWNPELDHYAEEERQRTAKMWKEAGGGVPVVTADMSNHDKWTNKPGPQVEQSPGFRGEQETRQRAGAEHKKYQRFTPGKFNPGHEEDVNPQSTNYGG